MSFSEQNVETRVADNHFVNQVVTSVLFCGDRFCVDTNMHLFTLIKPAFLDQKLDIDI